MTRKTKLLIAAGLVALTGTVAVTGASYARGSWHNGPSGAYGSGFHGGHHAGRHGPGNSGRCSGGDHGKRGHQMLKRYDSDQDGKLTQSEIDQGREANLAKFDSNQDGTLSLGEFEVLWLDFMRERMVDRFQDLDADGDSTVTSEEYKEPFASLVEDMDRNGDGALSRDDKRASHRDKRKGGDADD